MTAITTPGPTAYPAAYPITGSLTGPTATESTAAESTAADPTVYPPGFPAPAHASLIGPSANVTPPWYTQKRYAFPVIALALFVILVAVVGSRGTAAPAVTTPSPVVEAVPAPVVEAVPAPVVEPDPAPPVLPKTDDELSGMYYKGTFRVGSQIQPGTYQTTGPTTQEDGRWARLSATTGNPTAVIAYGIVNGPATITILPTDAAVEFSGDVVWIKTEAPAPAPVPAPAPKPAPAPEPKPAPAPAPKAERVTTFGDGLYRVGDQIQPGTYETTGPNTGSGMGYWARLSNTSGEGSAIITNDIVTGPATMTIAPTDKAVKFSGGAVWTKMP